MQWCSMRSFQLWHWLDFSGGFKDLSASNAELIRAISEKKKFPSIIFQFIFIWINDVSVVPVPIPSSYRWMYAKSRLECERIYIHYIHTYYSGLFLTFILQWTYGRPRYEKTGSFLYTSIYFYFCNRKSFLSFLYVYVPSPTHIFYMPLLVHIK